MNSYVNDVVVVFSFLVVFDTGAGTLVTVTMCNK
jgi:hypothetical protein